MPVRRRYDFFRQVLPRPRRLSNCRHAARSLKGTVASCRSLLRTRAGSLPLLILSSPAQSDPDVPLIADTGAPPPEDRASLAFWLAWGATMAVYVGGEALPFLLEANPFPGLAQWLLGARIEVLLVLGLLIAAPVAWSRRSTPPVSRRQLPPRDSIATAWVTALGLGILGAVASAAAGAPLSGLPPAYHDEYSYLFQARTFLAGKFSFESPPLRELFDQIHVLNDGRMASRYFPAAGAWMVPFVWLGNPIWGWWLAQGIITSLAYAVGRKLGGSRCGMVAGLLTALCPGLLLFSNLLLAHHPTLLGLGVFQIAILQTLASGQRRWALAAGCGLAFAALARPMTAAGAALPWGLYLVWRAFLHRRELRFWPALAAPLIAGGLFTLAYDFAITGSPWQTPYGQYTALYTPRHVYGFNNVIRGEQHLGPRVIENYDRWAENLTPGLAAKNVRNRLLTSAQWTLGLLPVVFGLVLGLVLWPWLSPGARLCLASIVSLHVVHVPYWFDGIFHFHYVFETLPLWLLFLSAGGTLAGAEWRRQGRLWISRWCVLAVAISVGMNFTVEQGLWGAPFRDGSSQLLFARQQYQGFRSRLQREVTRRPALVLVEADPADRHIDYVVNDPPLVGEMLIGRYLPERFSTGEIESAWPGRALYLYRVRQGTLEPLR